MSVRGHAESRTTGAAGLTSGLNAQNARCSGVIARSCEATGAGVVIGGGPYRAAANPLGNRVNVPGLELGAPARHARESLGMLHGFQEGALVRIARDDRRSGFATAQ